MNRGEASSTSGALGPRERSRLAANVSGHRRRAGLSREELAFLAMMPDRLARIEAGGRVDTGLDVWVRIAGSLGVDLADLLDRVDWDPASQRFLVMTASGLREVEWLIQLVQTPGHPIFEFSSSRY